MADRINKIKILLIIMMIIILLYVFIVNTDWFWKLIYPLKYKEIILLNADQYNIDPYLISAIIYVESKFKVDACSHKGAIGLMQIMPATGKWIAEQLSYDHYNKEMLFDPEINIKFGSWYLANLDKEFNSEIIIILTAYNAGSGNVKKWLQERWDGQHKSVSELPYEETRNYVNRILKVYDYYKKIYVLN